MMISGFTVDRNMVNSVIMAYPKIGMGQITPLLSLGLVCKSHFKILASYLSIFLLLICC